jgi:hypothetical protein
MTSSRLDSLLTWVGTIPTTTMNRPLIQRLSTSTFWNSLLFSSNSGYACNSFTQHTPPRPKSSRVSRISSTGRSLSPGQSRQHLSPFLAALCVKNKTGLYSALSPPPHSFPLSSLPCFSLLRAGTPHCRSCKCECRSLVALQEIPVVGSRQRSGLQCKQQDYGRLSRPFL